jgi:hypothetical protein
MADGSAECLFAQVGLSGPGDLGAELSNCQDILWRDRSMPKDSSCAHKGLMTN